MFGGTGKKAFIRTQIPLTERLLSWSLLGLIAAVGVAIYLKGQRYDPGLFALDVSALVQTSSARVQVERLVEESDEGTVATAESAGFAESTATPTRLLDGLAPDGWQRMGPVEQFDADNLYEKINGRAEQYLAYDVVGLTCVSLAEPGGQYVDLSVYDMGQPLHAFGIYSVERAPEHAPVDIGREGYRVAASYFFWKGPHYVQVLASDTGGELQQTAAQVARALESRLPDSGEEIWGLSVLPAENQQPSSLQYFKRDALSLDFLTNAYTALYQQNGVEVTAFLSRQESPQQARQTLDAYLAYLQSYGEITARRSIGASTLHVGDLGGFYDAVFQQDDIVGGVAMAEDQTAAEQVATILLRNLGDR